MAAILGAIATEVVAQQGPTTLRVLLAPSSLHANCIRVQTIVHDASGPCCHEMSLRLGHIDLIHARPAFVEVVKILLLILARWNVHEQCSSRAVPPATGHDDEAWGSAER